MRKLKVTELNQRKWIDENITPDTTLNYTYHLYTFAGDNSSSDISETFDVIFPAPTNLHVVKLTDISNKLTWEIGRAHV